MHMQEERDQQHVKVLNDLRRIDKVISESKKEAQAEHRSTKNSIRGLEKRVNSLEDSRHHSQAIRHVVAAGLEETDPEVREARKHVHEAICAHDDASSAYSGIHSRHSFDEETDKNILIVPYDPELDFMNFVDLYGNYLEPDDKDLL